MVTNVMHLVPVTRASAVTPIGTRMTAEHDNARTVATRPSA